MLWPCTCLLSYWREVMWSGDHAHLGMCLRAYGVLKCVMFLFISVFALCLQDSKWPDEDSRAMCFKVASLPSALCRALLWWHLKFAPALTQRLASPSQCVPSFQNPCGDTSTSCSPHRLSTTVLCWTFGSSTASSCLPSYGSVSDSSLPCLVMGFCACALPHSPLCSPFHSGVLTSHLPPHHIHIDDVYVSLQPIFIAAAIDYHHH